MKLVPWIVALCNKRWQDEFDDIVTQLDKNSSDEPVVRSIPTKEEIMEVINNQPTHLSSRFQPRRRKNRRYTSKPLLKESSLDRIIKEEFKQLSKGGDR